MARIRTIKPEFFTSDDICALSPRARLLYVGLWCEADRDGRLVWVPRGFKRRYLPDDDCDIDALCAELLARDLVRLYGKGLAWIPTFSTHQHVNPRETPSRLPIPPSVDHASDRVADASPPVSNAVSDAQGGKERKGREDHSEEPEGSSGADAPRPSAELRKEVFDGGVRILEAAGKPQDAARRIIGKWCKGYGDEAVLAAIREAERTGVAEPVSFIAACLEARRSTDEQPRTADEVLAALERDGTYDGVLI